VGNYLNAAIDPSEEAALVAEWRARVFPVVVPDPVDPPVVVPVRPGWLNDADLAWLDARYARI